jgi:hypothetical protein
MATRIELRATADQPAREVLVQQDYNAVAVSVNRAVSQGEPFLPLTGEDGKGITIDPALVDDISEV